MILTGETGVGTKGESCAYRHCKEIFHPQRKTQRFCSQRCREAYAYDVRRAEIGVKKPRKRHLATTLPGSTENGHKTAIETVSCKHPQTPDFGAFVRAQILAQQDQDNPISFVCPDGQRGRVWLASKLNKDGTYSKVIGDDQHWRINVKASIRVDHKAPPALMPEPTKLDAYDTYKASLLPEGSYRSLEAEASIEIDANGYPELPAFLDRRPLKLKAAA